MGRLRLGFHVRELYYSPLFETLDRPWSLPVEGSKNLGSDAYDRTFRRVRQDNDPGFGALYDTDIGAAPRHSRIGEARDERVAWLSAVSARFGEHDRTECAR